MSQININQNIDHIFSNIDNDIEKVRSGLNHDITQIDLILNQFGELIKRNININGNNYILTNQRKALKKELYEINNYKDTLYNKLYKSMYALLQNIAEYDYKILNNNGINKSVELSKYFNGFTNDSNEPTDGHFIKYPSNELPSYNYNHIKQIISHICTAFDKMQNKITIIDNIKDVCKKNIENGFKLGSVEEKLTQCNENIKKNRDKFIEDMSSRFNSFVVENTEYMSKLDEIVHLIDKDALEFKFNLE